MREEEGQGLEKRLLRGETFTGSLWGKGNESTENNEDDQKEKAWSSTIAPFF